MANEDEPQEIPFLDEESHEIDRKWLLERAIPDVVKRVVERAVETGVEKITEGPENLRNLVGDMKVPKEVIQYLYGQVDETKKGVYRVVAKEIRDVLEHTNFSDEIADVLTKLSFEISTTVRFVPNASKKDGEQDPSASDSDSDNQSGRKIPRPQVVSKVVMKARDALTGKDSRE